MSNELNEDLGSGTTPDDPFAVLRRRRRGVRVTTAAAVALGLALTGGAVAGAAGTTATTTTPASHAGPMGAPGGTPPAAVGKVTAVAADSFTLTSRDGSTVTVDVGSATTYADQGVTSPSLTDVKVGEFVAAFGSKSSNTVTATKVAIGGPGAPGGSGGPGGPGGTPPTAIGTVATIGTNTFTVTTEKGTTVIVDVSATTTYRKFGSSSASISDISVGTHVAVFGTDSSNTVTATSVGIGTPPNGGAPGGKGPIGAPPAASGSTSSSTSSGA